MDVVIIGAGIVGSGVAYYLAREGLSAVVIEERFPCAGATGACNGGLSYIGKAADLIEQSRASLEMYRDLERDLGCDVELDQGRGLIYVAEDEAGLDSLERVAGDCAEHGLHAVMLDRKGVAAREPLIDHSRCAGGLTGYSGLEGLVNPFLVTHGFLTAARRLGARLITGLRADSLLLAGKRVEGLSAGGVEIRAGNVVDCAGIHAGRVAAPRVSFPITPRRGVVIVTEPSPTSASSNILSAGYLSAEKAPASPGVLIGLAIEQAAPGNFIIGSSREFAGENRGCPPHIMEAVARNAVRYVPYLRHLSAIRVFAGLRPYTPDGMPVIGPVEGMEGYFVASGLEGSGITMGPWVSRRISDMVLGKDPADVRRFSPSRFRGLSSPVTAAGGVP
ncbi:MAG: FAD-binding oxidoreductase [Firmicutes bacterium]|nr:FAD-binding oxidoreductase [Bacillota bacterium]